MELKDMKKYEFNVNLKSKMTLEVLASSKEEAKEMVEDLLANSSIKDIELKQSKNKDITVKSSNVFKDIYDGNRGLAYER